MKKKILSIILAVVMIVGMIPLSAISAFAEETTVGTEKYIVRSWDDTEKKVTEKEEDIPTDAIEVTSDTTTLLEGKWYVVSKDVTVSSKITVNGTESSPTNLILMDGCKLTAEKGILLPKGKFLNIYGQSDNTGTVEATGSEWCAGIGGGNGGNGGTLTVYGGTVTANGGINGAGIGGGYGGNGGTLTVNGGTVFATGDDFAAGIGGGNSYDDNGGNGGTVTVNGGTVFATGGYGGAGIGGGFGYDDNGGHSYGSNGVNGGTLTVNSGTVFATGTMGAGIGGGNFGDGGNVYIYGGTVNATGNACGAGIGGGNEGDGGMITVYNGIVNATGDFDDFGLGGGAGIGGGRKGNGGIVKIYGGIVTAVSKHKIEPQIEAEGIGHGAEASESGSLELGDSAVIEAGNDENDAEEVPEYKGEEYVRIHWHNFIDGECFCGKSTNYIVRGWNGEKVTETKKLIPEDAIKLESSDTEITLSAGAWYVVFGEVDVPTITVEGTPDNPTSLILTDGCTLTVTGGIIVEADNALNIYGQKEDSGTVIATGGRYNAGIGSIAHVSGDAKRACGTVVIHGGTVNATGDITVGSAGIGGGGGYSDGGTVIIYGGTVNAYGDRGAAGIGGGPFGNGGDVYIYGGAVTADIYKEYGGAGIGAGAGGKTNGTLTLGVSPIIKEGKSANEAEKVSEYSGKYYVQIHYHTSEMFKSTGDTEHRCSFCGETEEHNFIDGYCFCGEREPTITVPAKDATCTDYGWQQYYTWNGKLYEDELCTKEITNFTEWSGYIKPHHTVVTDAAVAPTCVDTGLTEGSHCSFCGEVLKAQETIPETGIHTWTYNNSTQHICSGCGKVEDHSFTGDVCDICGKSNEYIDCHYDETLKAVVSEAKTIPQDAVKITSDMTFFDAEWYIVSENVTVSDMVLVGTANVNIILMDGCTLTVEGNIQIWQSDAPNIYGQKANTGTINVINTPGLIGIVGNITVYGGNIISCGGAGMFGISGNVTVFDGTVNADGERSIDGVLTVYGGIVNATGNGSDSSIKGSVTVYGGTVTASGGERGAGIGGVLTLGDFAVIKAGNSADDAEFVDRYTQERYVQIHFHSGENVIRLDDEQHHCLFCGITEDHHYIGRVCGCGEIETLTVTFDMQGHGTSVEDQFIKAFTKVQKPDEPTDEGYVFDGWFKEPECITPWDFDTDTIKDDTTLYAKWVIDTCNVRFILSGGKGGAATVAHYGKALENIEIPTKDGLVFYGYYDFDGVKYFDANGNGVKVWDKETAEDVLIAYWVEASTHVHSFSPDWAFDDIHHWKNCTCGHTVVDAFGTHDYEITKEDNLTKYTCKVCGYTKYEQDADTCTVTFDTQGLGGEVPSQIVKKNSHVTRPTPDPSYENRIFGGWYEEAECIHEWDFSNYVVSDDTTLYAKWISTSCTLRLYMGDENDSRVKYSYVHYGQDLPDIEPPTREGLVFLGYYLVGEMGTPSVQYYNAYGKGVRKWDIETSIATLVAFWAPSGSGHEHTFADTYTHNDTHHWRVCICEGDACKGNVTDFDTHTFGEGVKEGNKTTYTCKCGYTKVVYDKPDEEGEIVTGISYTGISLTLGSDISINFYMALSDDAKQNGTMTFNIGGRVVSGTKAKYNETEKKYYFSTPLTALEMAETVKATFTYNGVEYVQKYSVADYIDKIVGNEEKYGTEAAALARKIANYGYYAQIYLESIHTNVHIVDPYVEPEKGYDRMDKFASFDIDTQAAIEALANYTVKVTGESDNISLYGSTVYFDSATALNYYVTVKNGEPTATAVNKVTGETKQVEIKLYKDNIYIVSVKDITATELADDIEVKINGEITLTGSVFAYCNSVIAAHSFEGATAKDTFAVNAMAAFYEYYDAAMEYISFDLHFDIPEKYKVFTADGEEITGEKTVKCYRTFSFRLVPDDKYIISMVIAEGLREPDENGLYTVSFTGGKHNVVVYTELDTYRLTVNVEGENAGEMTNTMISFEYDSHEIVYAQCVTPGIYKMDVPKGKFGTIVITKSGYQEYRLEFTADGTVEEISVSLVPESFSVTFNMMEHGKQISSQTVEKGGKVTKPTSPTADDKEFAGWYKDSNYNEKWDFDTDTVTANTTLYAKWREKTDFSQYSLCGDINGQEYGMTSAPIPSDGPYVFSSDGKLTATFTGTTNVRLIALRDFGYEWYSFEESAHDGRTRKLYLTFFYNRYEGYRMNVPEGRQVTFTLSKDENGDLMLGYEVPPYTVSFNMMEHGTQIPDQTVEYGGYAQKPADPTEEGYIFDGWFEDENCTVPYYWDSTWDWVNRDITLYAKWTPIQ